eukprot:214944-Pyramimonas_sp.AAC.1
MHDLCQCTTRSIPNLSWLVWSRLKRGLGTRHGMLRVPVLAAGHVYAGRVSRGWVRLGMRGGSTNRPREFHVLDSEDSTCENLNRSRRKATFGVRFAENHRFRTAGP